METKEKINSKKVKKGNPKKVKVKKCKSWKIKKGEKRFKKKVNRVDKGKRT